MEKFGALNTSNAFALPTLSGTAGLVSHVEMGKSLMATVDAVAHQAQSSTEINVCSSQSTNAKTSKTHNGAATNVFVCLAFPSKV